MRQKDGKKSRRKQGPVGGKNVTEKVNSYCEDEKHKSRDEKQTKRIKKKERKINV